MPDLAAAALGPNFLAQFRRYLDTADLAGAAAQPSPAPGGTTAAPGATGPAGQGVNGPSPPAAPDPAAAAALPSAMEQAIQSLFAMMPPNWSSDDTEVVLAAIEAKLDKVVNDLAKGSIANDSQRQIALAEARQALIKLADDAMQAAQAEQKKAGVLGDVKLAFAYLGAILTIAAGVLVALTAPLTAGGSLLVGGLLIAAGVMMLMMAIDQTMATVPGPDGQPGEGFIAMTADAITKALYPDDPDEQKSEAAKWTLGLTIALMVASAVCGIAGAAIDPAALADELVELPGMVAELQGAAAEGAEAGEGASAAAEGGETAADAATDAAGDAESAAEAEPPAAEPPAEEPPATVKEPLKPKTWKDHARTGVRVAQGVNDTANAGFSVAPTVLTYQADTESADAEDNTSQATALKAVEDFVDAMVTLLMDQIKAEGNRFSTALSSLTEAIKDHSDSVSHVRFRS